MRNLKRALSLAMASVMLLGMMVVGTSAAGYADVTSEDHQEAIEVLQTVGIMVGDTQGNFNPDQKVTRNEMAVIMSNLMDYNVASYSGTTPFTDLSDWAEPYVAACYTHGITGGTSATTFSGDDPVTTVQAALMLMKALGYFQYASDFSTSWELATITQGSKIDLFVDVESGVYDAMTRNEVAQLVLNTLESGTVEPDDDTINITSPDGTTIQAGKVNYLYVTSREDYATTIKTDNGTSANSINGLSAPIVDLGEKLYRGDLQRFENAQDEFGRPGTTWRYKTNDIGTYADEATAVYTAKVTKGTLFSLVGRSNVNNLNATTLSVYQDGQWQTGNQVSNYFSNNSTAAAGISGNGVVTEVYMDKDGNVTIAQIVTYLAQANGDFNSNKGTLDTVTLTGPASFNVGTLDEEDFDNLADFSDEDYILYTASTNDGRNYTVESIAKAQVVTGEVTRYSETSSVTLDGTEYKYAKYIEGSKAFGNATEVDSAATQYMVGAQSSVVVDNYGYVLYVDDASLSVGNYLYVNGMVSGTGLGTTYTANAYFSDGTNKPITVEKIYNDEVNGTGEEIKPTDAPLQVGDANGHKYDGWYSYSVSNDQYTLRRADTNANGITGSDSRESITAVANGKIIESGKVNFLVGNSSLKGDDNTIFIVDDGTNVKTYTGIKNVPDISFDGSLEASPKNAYVGWVLSKDESGKFAALVFVDADNEDIEIDGASTDVTLFVLDKDSSYVDRTNGDTIVVWNAILNGEVTKIEAKDGELAAYKMYSQVTVDSDGYYEAELFKAETGTNEYMNASFTGQVEYSNGTLALGTKGAYTVGSDTKIVLVLQEDGDASNSVNSILVDKDADYEISTGLNGRGLANMLRGYNVTAGKLYGVLAGDADETVELTTLYVIVTGVAVAP